MQKKVTPLIKSISLKYNVPLDVVKAIINSQFECAREEAKKGEKGKPETFRNVRFKHLGLLVAKPSKIMAIHNAKRTRDRIRDSNTKMVPDSGSIRRGGVHTAEDKDSNSSEECT
jgi:hypothetical protein